jgi:hypothetical protein
VPNSIRVLPPNLLSAIEHLLKPGTSGGADDPIHLLAVDQHDEARNAIDFMLPRQLHIATHVHLANWKALLDETLNRRLHLHARWAAGRPEIQ